MTIKYLKEKIQFLPDNMKVGGSGHFGEFLECFDAEVRSVALGNGMISETQKTNILCISIESPGEEPD